MIAIRGIVKRSTGTELKVKLENGHFLYAPPNPRKFKYGQAVFVNFDSTKSRIRSIEHVDIIEDLEGSEVEVPEVPEDDGASDQFGCGIGH